MKRYYADRTCLNLIRALCLFLAAGLSLAVRLLLYTIPILMWALVGVFIAAYVFFCLIYLPLWFSRAVYMASAHEVVRRSGVFFRRSEYMKATAVQHISTITTPFSRYTGLNFLLVSALGGSLLLPFLSRHDAEEIAALLSRECGERGRSLDG